MIVGDASVSVEIYDDEWCKPIPPLAVTGKATITRTLKVTGSPCGWEKKSYGAPGQDISASWISSPSGPASLLDLIVFPHRGDGSPVKDGWTSWRRWRFPCEGALD